MNAPLAQPCGCTNALVSTPELDKKISTISTALDFSGLVMPDPNNQYGKYIIISLQSQM